MKTKLFLFPLGGIFIALIFGMIVEGTGLRAASLTRQSRSAVKTSSTAPVAFMHRPYYGNQTIGQRTVSFVDHDKPWYDNDGTFVRYDGAKWTNVSIGTCIGGVNCYDGHNGYDLNMRFEPVLSTAAGTVVRAGWYNPLDHNSALGLWAAVDHHNGYVTAYGHLSALMVAMGDQIGTQWQVGTSGTTGSSTGPHLHMATYYYPSWNATDPFGWTGNYPDPNTVPDNYLWVSNPATNGTVPLLSANGSNVYPGATLIDDGNTGWSSTGGWSSVSVNGSIQGDLHWATTSSGSATATATWQPTISKDGYYEVGAFVDASYATSSWVPYTVYSADPNHPASQVSHAIYLDESHIGAFQGPFGPLNTGPQWVSLGTYYFKSSMPARVVMSNATGEAGAQVAADSVEFVPVASQTGSSSRIYGFSVATDTTPATMVQGSVDTVTLSLQNTSNFIWSAGGATPDRLVYRWLNAKNQAVATSAPITLPRDVLVNDIVSMTLPVQAPGNASSYVLQWDMSEGSTLFSELGAPQQSEKITILRAQPYKPTV